MSDSDEPTFSGPDPEAWDAHDPRRKHDCFAPPTEPCECYCMHCQRVFSSEGIWFQKIIHDRPIEKGESDLDGMWLCPTNNCGGAGFTFDIFPTDPDHPANAGWVYTDDDEEEFLDEEAEGEADWSPEREAAMADDPIPFGHADDTIIEGDEWKLGYSPDQPAPQGIYGSAEERAEQERYDAPDERPREIKLSERPKRTAFNDADENDLPF